MTTQLSSQHEKESAALKSQLIEMEKQLTAEKELVKNLTAKSTELQNKLNEAKAAAAKATAPIPAEPPSAGGTNAASGTTRRSLAARPTAPITTIHGFCSVAKT